MKIAYGSDFHFEFMSYETAQWIIESWVFPEDTELIIIAGDLHLGAENAVNIMNDIFLVHNIPVVYVPGNHEYYESSFEKENSIFRKLRNKYEINYYILLNDALEFNGINIFGCMGNIDGSFEEINIWKHGALNDFHLISDFDNHEVYGRRERKNLNFQAKENPIDIVITHTMPSPRCISEKYKGDFLNPCFANDWTEEIYTIQPKFWICGHTHDPFEMCIDKTNVVCNPVGYPHENYDWEWKYFNV